MQFIRTIVEQMEDAQPLINAAGVRQIRLGFILVDNVAELWLLRRAQTLAVNRTWGPDHEAKARMAEARRVVERQYDDKVREVRRGHPNLGLHLDVVTICHKVRNDLYHWGSLRSEILGPLARAFYHAVVEMLSAIPLSSMSSRSGDDDDAWCAARGIPGGLSFEGWPALAQGLHAAVPSAMPELAQAMEWYLSARVTDTLEGLDYLVENAEGDGWKTAEDALADVQFSSEMDEKNAWGGPAHSAEEGRAMFEAIDAARAAFKPKVNVQHIRGWARRAERLGGETRELNLIRTFGDIDANLTPIEQIVGEAVFELDMHIDRQMDEERLHR